MAYLADNAGNKRLKYVYNSPASEAIFKQEMVRDSRVGPSGSNYFYEYHSSHSFCRTFSLLALD